MTSSESATRAQESATSITMVQSKTSQGRAVPRTPTFQTSIISSLLRNATTEKAETVNVTDEEEGSSADSTPNVSSSHTPAPGTSLPQGPRVSAKRLRAKTSRIHDYVTTQGDNFVCNRCSRTYKTSGGTGAISRHLKKAHSIDPTASGVPEKRIRERTAIDAAIMRGAERNVKAEEKRREKLMGIGLDQNTLELLYLQWTLSSDIPLKHVRDSAFRTFLEYVNPVANRMLPDSEATIKSHAERLLADGKLVGNGTGNSFRVMR